MSGAPGAVRLYEQAVAHQAAGRPDAAERCYREALGLHPDYPQAHHGLANLLGRLDRLEEAAAHYREALRLRPDWAAAHYNLGHLLNRLGRIEEAAECYRRALRLKRDFPEALNNLAHILNRLARYEEAERSCRAALRLKPDNPAAHNNLGNALSGLCRFAEAEASYRAALRLNPDLPETQRNLGDVLGTLRRYEEAVDCYRTALRLRPSMADAWNNLGLSLGTLGEPEEAERCYEAALRLKPDFASAQINRCIGRLRIVYRDEAEIERARAAYAGDLEAVCRLEGPEALAAAGKPPFLLAYQGRVDRELQARQGVIPLAGNPLQATAGRLDLPGLHLPEPLAADTNVTDQAGAGQDVQMLGDGLARDVGAVGEPRNGQRPAGAQAGHQGEPGLVAQGGENRGRAPDAVAVGIAGAVSRAVFR